MTTEKAVLTAYALDLPCGEDLYAIEEYGKLNFHDFKSHKWYSPKLDRIIRELSGGAIAMASFPESNIERIDRKDFKRRTTVRLFHCINRMLTKAGGKKNKILQKAGIAKIIGYSFFTNDARMNPFNFKANLEHQTAAPMGKWLHCTGPQFVFKEGDNCDLTGIGYLASIMRYLPGPMIVAGISEPHPLLTSMEVIYEGHDLKKAGLDSAGINLCFCEGTAAVLMESQTAAHQAKRIPFATIEASRQSIRNFNYSNLKSIEDHLEKNIETLVQAASGDIRTVFVCRRRNSKVADMEQRVLTRLLPQANQISTADILGDLGPVSGLLDIVYALAGNEKKRFFGHKNNGAILIHKISRTGQYAGIVLKGFIQDE
jgi:hypothetical protein